MSDDLATPWPHDASRMAERVRSFDWSQTSLGPIDEWPDRLRLMVELVLASPKVSSLVCGSERLLVYNDSAAWHFGDRHPEALGRPLPEAFPEGWTTVAPFYERAFAGETVEVGAQPLDTRGEGSAADVFEATLTPVRDERGHVAFVHMIGREIGSLVRANDALRASEERHAFLLELSDALRPLSDPVELQTAAMRLLAERLDVMRATYFEIEEDQDTFRVTARFERNAVPIPERMRLSDFSPALIEGYRAGRTLHVTDTQYQSEFVTQPRAYLDIGVRAWAAVPLARNGRLVAWVGVHSATPRDWSRSELQVLEDVAERTWTAIDLAFAQRRTEQLNALLVRFSEAVDGLVGAGAVAEAACRLVAEALGTERAYWAEVDWATRDYVIGAGFHASGVPVVSGRFPLASWEPFTSYHLAGRPVAVDDVETDARVSPAMRQGYAEIGVGADLAAAVSVSGQLRGTLAVNQRLPRRWYREEVALVQGVAGRTWAAVERARAEEALRISEERYRTLFERIDEGFCIIEVIFEAETPVDYRFIEVNPAFSHHTGITDAEGRLMREIAPDHEQHWFDAYGEVAVTGRAKRFVAPAKALGDRWYDLNVFPVGEPDQRRVAIVFTDITDRMKVQDTLRDSEAQLQVMVAELQHRTRNLIGVVGSVARQTMAETGPTEAFQRAFADRIKALSRVQGLLSRAGDERVTIREVIKMELDALGATALGSRVSAEGPVVALRKSTVQTLALAIHELATNACKYGALAGGHGELAVRWTTHRKEGEERRLFVEWTERGATVRLVKGAPITQGGGYGRELIEKALPYSLNAQTTYELGAQGLRCTIDLPLARDGGDSE